MKSIEELIEATSQYIEARDEYDRMDGPSGRQLDNMSFAYERLKTALKSALEKPVEKEQESEYPKYYQSIDGNLFKFDDARRGATRFFVDKGLWGICTNAWSLDEVTGETYLGVPIPTADALAIIEKAKQNDQPAK